MSQQTAASTARDTKSTTGAALQTTQGTTSIADQVVSKIAGIATREVSGVHGLGGGAARTIGSLRERIPGAKTDVSQGIAVEVGEKQAAVDVTVVAEYGVAIADLAAGTPRDVISSVERMTGLDVTEVDVEVVDVFVPGLDDDDSDDDEQDQPQRRSSRVECPPPGPPSPEAVPATDRDAGAPPPGCAGVVLRPDG